MSDTFTKMIKYYNKKSLSHNQFQNSLNLLLCYSFYFNMPNFGNWQTLVFFWKKILFILCETNNIFCSQEYWVWHKVNAIFWSFIKNEHEVMLDSFWNFAYVSSYLHSKSFSWKQDYVISQKLQMPQTSSRPF